MRTTAPLLLAVALAAWPLRADALSMADPLTAWQQATTMDRMQLATRFGKSFVAMDESFTANYFLKCIDDIAGYGGAKEAKIEDAMRECVAAPMRLKGQTDD